MKRTKKLKPKPTAEAENVKADLPPISNVITIVKELKITEAGKEQRLNVLISAVEKQCEKLTEGLEAVTQTMEGQKIGYRVHMNAYENERARLHAKPRKHAERLNPADAEDVNAIEDALQVTADIRSRTEAMIETFIFKLETAQNHLAFLVKLKNLCKKGEEHMIYFSANDFKTLMIYEEILFSDKVNEAK